MINLVRFFIDRPKLGHLIFFMVILLGLLSLQLSRYEVTPKIDMGIVSVTTYKAGAGPEEIELSISKVLEDELLKVSGIKKIYSRSMEGLSLITLNLDPNYGNKQKLLADIQKAVDRAQTLLPSDLLEKPKVVEQSTDELAVTELHITGHISENVLRQQARLLEQKLRTVYGVAGIDRKGYRKREINIQPDPRMLLQHGISVADIQQAMASRNIRDSGGSIASLSMEKKVLTVGQFQSARDVEDVILRSRGPGNAVTMRDVARVYSGYQDWGVQVQADGQLSIALEIKKKARADELDTMAAIKTFLKTEEALLPDGIQLKLVNDVSRFTKEMLETLTNNALMGFISVFIILWLFLGRKMAFWVSVGLPFSMMATFIGLLLTGYSMNSITLMALILVLGMLVDDAIVTGEAIQARRESGESRINAAILGTVDISAPVFVSVLTTILAFVPLFFIGGLEGAFVASIPIVVIIMLLASLFESKFLLPSHLAHSQFTTKPRNWLSGIQQRYEKLIHWLLLHRKKSVGLMLLISAGIMALSSSAIRMQLYPETAIDTINIKMELPNGTPFEKTVERTRQLEQRVRAQIPARDLLDIITQVGHHDTDAYGGSEGRNHAWALMTVFIKSEKQLSLSSVEILDRLKELGNQQTDFVSIRVEPLKDTPVIGKPVELEIMSSGNEKLQVADSVKQFLSTAPGVTEVWDSRKSGKDILDVEFNYQNLAAYGLSVKQVADAVAVAMDGLIINEQQMAEERVYYRLQFPKQERQQLITLQDLFIINSTGKPVALNSVASFRLRPGEADIKHYAGRRTVTVYADINRDLTDVPTINKQLRAFLNDQGWEHQYPGLSFYQGGELEQQQASYGSLGLAFAACLFMILFVLVVLFNSFTQPFLVLAVLPFSIIGVMVAFAVQDLPMSFLSLTGMLGLIGVLINDAVVMIFTLNRKAHTRDMALIARQAASRFRPIIITSLTTLAGLFPTAYGWGGSNAYITPMVMSMA
ncbi:efflux RND transporter permease subunit [Endozoicomonadaceae bacterium StTr2]